MANKFRGEAELNFTRDVDGAEKEAKFKLVFDANAFCEIEDVTGLNLGGMLEAMQKPENMSMKFVRGVVFGGLTRNHPEVTIVEAGDIISDAGMETVMEALRSAFSGAMKGKEGNVKKPGRQKS